LGKDVLDVFKKGKVGPKAAILARDVGEFAPKLMKFLGPIAGIFSGVSAGTEEYASSGKVGKSVGAGVGAGVGTAAGVAGGALAGEWIGAIVGSFLGPVGTWAGGAIGGAIGGWLGGEGGGALGKMIGKGFGSVFDFVAGSLKSGVTSGLGLLSLPFKAGAWLGQKIRSGIGSAFDFIGESAKSAVSSGIEILSGARKIISEYMDKAKAFFKNIWGSIVDWFGGNKDKNTNQPSDVGNKTNLTAYTNNAYNRGDIGAASMTEAKLNTLDRMTAIPNPTRNKIGPVARGATGLSRVVSPYTPSPKVEGVEGPVEAQETQAQLMEDLKNSMQQLVKLMTTNNNFTKDTSDATSTLADAYYAVESEKINTNSMLRAHEARVTAVAPTANAPKRT
jgi:hypothetical protein